MMCLLASSCPVDSPLLCVWSAVCGRPRPAGFACALYLIAAAVQPIPRLLRFARVRRLPGAIFVDALDPRRSMHPFSPSSPCRIHAVRSPAFFFGLATTRFPFAVAGSPARHIAICALLPPAPPSDRPRAICSRGLLIARLRRRVVRRRGRPVFGADCWLHVDASARDSLYRSMTHVRLTPRSVSRSRPRVRSRFLFLVPVCTAMARDAAVLTSFAATPRRSCSCCSDTRSAAPRYRREIVGRRRDPRFLPGTSSRR